MGYRDKEAFLSKHYCNLSKPSTLKQAEFNFSTSSRNSMLSGLIKEIPLSSKYLPQTIPNYQKFLPTKAFKLCGKCPKDVSQFKSHIT